MSVMSQKNRRQPALLISAAKRVVLAFGQEYKNVDQSRAI
jgi:hypothetical protein